MQQINCLEILRMPVDNTCQADIIESPRWRSQWLSGCPEITGNRAAAFKVVYAQLAIMAMAVTLLYVHSGLVVSYSASLGSAVHILPNICFVRCVFRETESQTPQSMMVWFYLGEALKIVMTILLFALCFALVESLHTLFFFGAYIVTMAVNLVGMALVRVKAPESQN